MNKFKLILVSFVIFTLIHCKRNTTEKNAILLADREAPLSWVSLKIYDNKTFEFIYSGIRNDDVYPGTFKISHDTLYFKYSGAIPKSGKTAIINGKYINYIDGKYHEFMEIKLNKLNN